MPLPTTEPPSAGGFAVWVAVFDGLGFGDGEVGTGAGLDGATDGLASGTSAMRCWLRLARSSARSGSREATGAAATGAAVTLVGVLSRSVAIVVPTRTATTAVPARRGRDLRDGRGKRPGASEPDKALPFV